MDANQEWLCRKCYSFNNGDKCRECFQPNIPFEEDKEYQCPSCDTGVSTFTRCKGCNSIGYEIWRCSRCYGYNCLKTYNSYCWHCHNKRPQSAEEFMADFKLACKQVPTIGDLVCRDKIFSSGYRYIKQSVVIGRQVSYHKYMFMIQGKITAMWEYSGLVSFLLLKPNDRICFYAFEPSHATRLIQLHQDITYAHIRLLFIAYYKEPESVFAQLPYETLHYLLRFLLD